LAYIYNYDNTGGTITYTFDSSSDVWTINSWSGPLDPSDINGRDAPSTETPGDTNFFVQTGEDGYTTNTTGTEVYEYIFNPKTGVYDISEGNITDIDPLDDSEVVLDDSSTDPNLSENQTPLAESVKADINQGNFVGAVNLCTSGHLENQLRQTA